MLEVRKELAETTQRELRVLLLGLAGIKVEYDTPTSGRGATHQSHTTSNDPRSEIILLLVP